MIRPVEFDKNDPLLQMKRSELGEQLASLQRAMKDTDKSLLVIVSGWESVGKGVVLNDLVRELDPRYYRFSEFEPSSKEDKKHPFLWRFFNEFPVHGRMAIFDHSYYLDLMHDLDADQLAFNQRVNDITYAERLLTDDGCLVMKFFLDQSKDSMEKNIKKLDDDEHLHFRLMPFDRYQLEHYKRFRSHFERILDATSTLEAPWYVINMDNGKDASAKVLASLVRSLNWHLQDKNGQNTQILPPVASRPMYNLDLNRALSKKAYHERLDDLQEEARIIMYYLYRKGIPVVCVFEGTDAAGKGGCIKRLTRQMDPRSYRVATTAAPTKYELSHHYLWRFYQTFPVPGHLTIYDRSWYGRVMVERIEGFTSRQRWQEAYAEINTMEKKLVESGYVVMKFLLVIDKDEQLRRFKDRQNTPEKHYKITKEDWRNREKFDDYVEAMNDMVVRTSTKDCPWTVISSQNKRYARILVLEHFIVRAAQALEEAGVDFDKEEKDYLKKVREDLKKLESGNFKEKDDVSEEQQPLLEESQTEAEAVKEE